MTKNLERAKSIYMDNAAKNAKENFDYFQVGDAYEAGANKALEFASAIFNSFLEKCGYFIQGIDAEEIYDMYKNAQTEILEQ